MLNKMRYTGKTKEDAIKDLERLNKSLTKGDKLFKF